MSRSTDETRRLRRYRPDDAKATAHVWYESGRLTYDFPGWRALTPERALEVFQRVIEPLEHLWVVESLTAPNPILGYLALEGQLIDRLYVHPAWQGSGVGGQLLSRAKRHSPQRLELYTHLCNVRARRFYESQGFLAVEWGISPPPESEPDVRYVWTPRRGSPSR